MNRREVAPNEDQPSRHSSTSLICVDFSTEGGKKQLSEETTTIDPERKMLKNFVEPTSLSEEDENVGEGAENNGKVKNSSAMTRALHHLTEQAVTPQRRM